VGVFRHPLEIGAGVDGPFESVEALVDTGSLYTWAPGSMLARLGLRPTGQRGFQLADGTAIRRDVTEALVRLAGQTGHTIVVFGGEHDQILLGAYTLEGFALCADPVNRRLVPMDLIPATAGIAG